MVLSPMMSRDADKGKYNEEIFVYRRRDKTRYN